MSSAQRILNEKTVSLELIKAHKEDGRPFYAYVAIIVSDLEALKQKKNEFTRLPDNCIVLYSDFGHEVPQKIKDNVIIEFNKLLKKPRS